MEKFTESLHCTSKAHCEICRSSQTWRDDIMTAFEWDGKCPFKELEYQIEVLDRMIKRGCKPCEKKQQQKWIEKLKNV